MLGRGKDELQRADAPAPPAVVIDGLCQPFELDKPLPLEPAVLEGIRGSGITAVNFTVPDLEDGFEATVRKIARVHAAVETHPDDLLIARRHADIARAGREGKLGLILDFQSTEMLDGDLSRIGTFRDLGVRVMQMTYNTRSPFGDGCLEPTDEGLSALGAEAIAAMNELGVAVDLSHAGPRTQAMGIAASNRPVLISHTGCRAVFDHPRNTPDDVLRALADGGGVVGIYLMPYLAGGSGPITTDMLLDHIDRAIDVCGADHVGIGSDQCLAPVDDGPAYRQWLRESVESRRRLGIAAPGESPDRPLFIPELNAARRMELIGAAMATRGHPSTVIEKVLGGNFDRVLRETWSARRTRPTRT